jgi:hypothetical protein
VVIEPHFLAASVRSLVRLVGDARRSHVAQAVLSAFDLDLVVAALRDSRRAQAVRKRQRHHLGIRVTRVFREVLVLRPLHGLERVHGVGAPLAQLVRAPHGDGDGGDHHQRDDDGEDLDHRETGLCAVRPVHGDGRRCQDKR